MSTESMNPPPPAPRVDRSSVAEFPFFFVVMSLNAPILDFLTVIKKDVN
jgi:hypothetical protein